MQPRRHHYYVEWLKDSYGYMRSGPRRDCPEDEANLVGSRVVGMDGWHVPSLDIDFEARLLPSKTPGHHHLYLDVPLTWSAYKQLLRCMGEIGILEEGYVDASIAEKESFLRVPSGGDSLEFQMTKRALDAEHRVKELEEEIAGLKELVAKLAVERNG